MVVRNEHPSKSGSRNHSPNTSNMGQQLVARGGPSALALRLEPLPGPQLLPPLQEVQDELVLGREIPVEGHLGRAGPGDHRVDTDGAHPFPAEELVGGTAHPLPPAVGRLP